MSVTNSEMHAKFLLLRFHLKAICRGVHSALPENLDRFSELWEREATEAKIWQKNLNIVPVAFFLQPQHHLLLIGYAAAGAGGV